VGRLPDPHGCLARFIGLEAFAQRDPLVQYKSQASEMFRNLLSEIRAGVISRMYLLPAAPRGRA
jgi:preprotein translocase subunit SecA